ncbi:hypothetical protein EVAR_29721_1 [Eumeta japonica]|uniref:Endonuclease/exonuclease/phosphatase domain-containing protein n=1 Tax=Eumeta variegata TaxID=151549 RepID=A0A4C1VZR5_EUMVA|nr:hypothetical protein EVAR_29721_1 [Eumeta japonica]
MSNAPGCSTPPAKRHKPKNLTLLTFNAHGLINNMVELGQCTKEYGIDIVLVQETLLKPNRPKSCTLAVYVQLRTDRTDAPLGGNAIYYKRSLQCCPIVLSNLSNIEGTGCRLVMMGHRTLVIVSIYLSSSKKLLRSDIEAFLVLRDAVILFGDFNCKNTNWGCAVSYPSDHSLLLRLGPTTGGCPKPTIKITDWKRVSTALEEVDTPALNNIPDVIETTDEIDSTIGACTNHIRVVVKRCSRVISASVDRWKLPADALELLRAKNTALRHGYAYPSRDNRSRAGVL